MFTSSFSLKIFCRVVSSKKSRRETHFAVKFDSVSNEHACLVTQLKWNSYLSISNMIPNLLVLFFNATCGHKFSLAPRLVIGQIIIIAIFAGTDAMTWVDTDEYQV